MAGLIDGNLEVAVASRDIPDTALFLMSEQHDDALRASKSDRLTHRRFQDIAASDGAVVIQRDDSFTDISLLRIE